MILGSAQGGGFLQEEVGVADFGEADRGRHGKQGKISGVCVGHLIIATTACPENKCVNRQSHHSQFFFKKKDIDVVRK